MRACGSSKEDAQATLVWKREATSALQALQRLMETSAPEAIDNEGADSAHSNMTAAVREAYGCAVRLHVAALGGGAPVVMQWAHEQLPAMEEEDTLRKLLRCPRIDALRLWLSSYDAKERGQMLRRREHVLALVVKARRLVDKSEAEEAMQRAAAGDDHIELLYRIQRAEALCADEALLVAARKRKVALSTENELQQAMVQRSPSVLKLAVGRAACVEGVHRTLLATSHERLGELTADQELKAAVHSHCTAALNKAIAVAEELPGCCQDTLADAKSRRKTWQAEEQLDEAIKTAPRDLRGASVIIDAVDNSLMSEGGSSPRLRQMLVHARQKLEVMSAEGLLRSSIQDRQVNCIEEAMKCAGAIRGSEWLDGGLMFQARCASYVCKADQALAAAADSSDLVQLQLCLHDAERIDSMMKNVNIAGISSQTWAAARRRCLELKMELEMDDPHPSKIHEYISRANAVPNFDQRLLDEAAGTLRVLEARRANQRLGAEVLA
eukprot:TRINITY_DN19720_c0_g2_i1.p1 TRINITY_DN19720_c0_g2~~TRINITY_DN19720_c0_g2_i1.p1  ORF type:complete len:533 (-),score=102.65 TRINITY_DN19720_c0_g2_i1:315-1805(-)